MKQDDFTIDYIQHNIFNDNNNISKHLAAVMRQVFHQAWQLWWLQWTCCSVPSCELASTAYCCFLLCYWKWNLWFEEEIRKQDVIYEKKTVKNVSLYHTPVPGWKGWRSHMRLKLILQDSFISTCLAYVEKLIPRDKHLTLEERISTLFTVLTLFLGG